MSWEEIRERHKQARANGKEYGTRALRAAGIEFRSLDNGWHLRMSHNGGIIDFTPGTGRWTIWHRDRSHGGQYRGVHALIHHIATGNKEGAGNAGS